MKKKGRNSRADRVNGKGRELARVQAEALGLRRPASGIISPKDFEQPRGCTVCNHLACVCNIVARHAEGCPFRVAATGAVGIACKPHGRDVCPECDKCTCKSEPGLGNKSRAKSIRETEQPRAALGTSHAGDRFSVLPVEPEPPKRNTRVIYKALDSDQCFTPKRERSIVHRILGDIDLDPCTSLANPLHARLFYTGLCGTSESWAVDGCVQWRWHPPERGQRWTVFFNPPYGLGINHWTHCAMALSEREPQAQILALVPCRPGARWYAKASTHAQLLCELNGRLVFETIDGEPMRDKKGRPSGARWGCAFLYWGPARLKVARVLRAYGVVRWGRSCPVRALPRDAAGDTRQEKLLFT